MKRRLSFGLISAGSLCAALGILLVACTPDTRAPTLAPRNTLAPTQAGGEAVAVALLEQTPALPPFTDFACLECHTDQGLLTDLAKPIVNDHEALSSGPG